MHYEISGDPRHFKLLQDAIQAARESAVDFCRVYCIDSSSTHPAFCVDGYVDQFGRYSQQFLTLPPMSDPLATLIEDK